MDDIRQRGRISQAEKRLLFVVTEDWFFVSHFLGLARAAAAAGYTVGVACRLSAHRAIIEAEGFAVFPLEGNRGSFAPLVALREVWAIRRAIVAFSPDIIHLVALRAIGLGGLPALLRRKAGIVVAPTGLGFLFASKRRGVRLVRSLLKRLVGGLARSDRVEFLFENGEDPLRFGLEPDAGNVCIVGGAGVDGMRFSALPPPPAPPVRFAVVARMLRAKGIEATVAAFGRARRVNPEIELHLFGTCDDGNPLSHTPAEVAAFAQIPDVFWHGHVEDVAKLWRDHHVAVLLSLREGMPRALAEAAASARPAIASDVTGCREIVIAGKTGLLIAANDVAAASEAMLRLAGDAELRATMGAAGRAHFEARFTLQAVSAAVLAVYARMMQKGEARG